MERRVSFFLLAGFIFPSLLLAQKAVTTNERLARLEEGQKAIHQRLDDVNKRIDNLNNSMDQRIDNLNNSMDQRINDLNNSMDQRFNDLRADMNKRFEDMNRKFNWLYMLLAAIIALNGAMVGSVIWLARQERPIGQRQYDQILDRELSLESEIREIKSRLDRLESA